jgi:hypothetical protein
VNLSELVALGVAQASQIVRLPSTLLHAIVSKA